MDVRPYTPDDRAACLAVFDTNVPAFFKPEERESFARFLDAPRPGPYFVLDHDGDVVGCGGWALDRDENAASDSGGGSGQVATLCWGMVRADLHGKGLGKFLLLYRIRDIGRQTPPAPAFIRLVTLPATAGFFEKFAFRVAGPVRPDGLVELRMKAQVCP